MAALGYPNAETWDDKKLGDRLRQVPDRVDADKVPSEHGKLYLELKGLKPEDELVVEGISDGKADSKPAPASKDKKPAKAPAKGKAKPDAQMELAPASKPAPAKKGKGKPESKKSSEHKVERPKREKLPVGEFGLREDSMMHKLLVVVKGHKGAMEEEAVVGAAKDAGIPEKSARQRLKRLAKRGFLTRSKTVLYTLPKKA